MGSHKDGGGRSFLPYFLPFSLVACDRGGSIINLGGGVCWTQSHQFDKKRPEKSAILCLITFPWNVCFTYE